jgi:alanine racemase
LKIDSGFGRIGVSVVNAKTFLQQVAQKKGLDLEGIYTHFSSSDVDLKYTQAQAKAFREVLESGLTAGVRPKWIHMANSSAILRLPETHGTLVRPGIAYYGIPPFPGAEKMIPLQPVATWKSRVIFLKNVPEGTKISYAGTWTAKRPSRIATLAAGYADGLPRLMSNKGHVLIGGQKLPILGRVTMDMTMVDVTELAECHVGDEAVLLGRQADAEISAVEIADAAGTNPYEIICRIGERVPRVVTHG